MKKTAPEIITLKFGLLFPSLSNDLKKNQAISNAEMQKGSQLQTTGTIEIQVSINNEETGRPFQSTRTLDHL